MVRLLRHELTRHHISIETTLAGDIPQMMEDRLQVQQVMINLIVNSIEAMKGVDGNAWFRSDRGDGTTTNS